MKDTLYMVATSDLGTLAISLTGGAFIMVVMVWIARAINGDMSAKRKGNQHD